MINTAPVTNYIIPMPLLYLPLKDQSLYAWFGLQPCSSDMPVSIRYVVRQLLGSLSVLVASRASDPLNRVDGQV
jgi:hypothetical protein